MKRLVLNQTNYLNHTRQELQALGFTSAEINSVVYEDKIMIEKVFSGVQNA